MMICYDYIDRYIRDTLAGSTGLPAELERYAAERGIPIARPEIAKLLVVIGRLKKPARILELGTAIGYSAILLASVLSPGGRVDTVEKDEEMAGIARENIDRAGLSGTVHVIVSDVTEVLPCLSGPYDMIFVDAAKGQYPDYLPECLRLLPSGGVLISDNVLYQGMVACDDLVPRRQRTITRRLRDYLSRLCGTEGVETTLLPAGDGVAVSVKL